MENDKKIISLNDINDNTIEGKMLLASIAKLTTESQTDKTPYEVIGQITELVETMYPQKGK